MRSILVTVDGSESSSVAAKYALSLCQLTGATLDALTLIDLKGNPSTGDGDTLASLAQRTGEALLSEIAEWAAAASVTCNTMIEYGDTQEQILYYSDTYDLTVLGATGASSSETALGHTAKAITSNAIRPVLVTRGEFKPIKRVLIGYNRSSAAASALRLVAEIAPSARWEITLAVGANSHAEGDALAQQAQAYLESYSLPSHPVVVIPEDGASAIFRATQNLTPDLIVVGSRGATALSRLLLGSTSQTVLEQADAPVLIVH